MSLWILLEDDWIAISGNGMEFRRNRKMYNLDSRLEEDGVSKTGPKDFLIAEKSCQLGDFQTHLRGLGGVHDQRAGTPNG